jgi:flagellar assembly factor FliW
MTDSEKREAGGLATPSAFVVEEQQFFFPEGLLGFSSHQNFVLSPYQPPDGSASPFFLLQAKDDDLCFPLISPDLLVADYSLALLPGVPAKLGASSTADLTVFAIVTLRERVAEITANLQGPVVLNPANRLGVQIIAEQYPLRHPLVNSTVS